jgi:hypothetical protein
MSARLLMQLGGLLMQLGGLPRLLQLAVLLLGVLQASRAQDTAAWQQGTLGLLGYGGVRLLQLEACRAIQQLGHPSALLCRRHLAIYCSLEAPGLGHTA